MDIFKEYDENEIYQLERIIEVKLKEDGICALNYDIIDIIAQISSKNVNEEYKDEENDDVNEEYYEDFEDNSLVKIIQDEGFSLDSAIDIILNDEEIIDLISNAIDEMVSYEDDTVQTKKINLDIISSALLVIYNIKENTSFNSSREYIKNTDKLDSLKHVINNKIEEMDYTDFIMLITDYGCRDILAKDNILQRCLIKKIEDMSLEQYAVYLKNIKYWDSISKEVKEVEKKKALTINSPYIEYLFNSNVKLGNDELIIRKKYDFFSLDIMEKYKYNAINKVIKDRKEQQAKQNEENKIIDEDTSLLYEISTYEISKMLEYQTYCEILKKLNKKEFVCFMLRNGGDSLYEDEQLIIEQKLNTLSRDDLIMLTNRLCFLELNFHETSDKENEPILLKIAKQKGIVNEQNEFICTAEEIKNANEKLVVYSRFTNSISVPNAMFQEEEDDDDLSLDELDFEERREYNYEKAEKIINKMLSTYKEIDELSKLSDKEIIKVINQFNIHVDSEEAIEKYKVFTTLLEYRILHLPAVYSSAFMFTGNGCLEDVMNLKIDEVKEQFEEFSVRKSAGTGTGRTTLSEIESAVEQQKRKLNPNNSNPNQSSSNNENSSHDNQDK